MHCKSYSHFFSKKFQHICVSLDVNFKESLTNDIVSFEQLSPEFFPENMMILHGHESHEMLIRSLSDVEKPFLFSDLTALTAVEK